MALRVVERTKVCTRCGHRKAWSEFHASKKWPDGTMRVPYSHCKPCSSAYRNERNKQRRREDPSWAKEYDRKTYVRLRTNPERWATRIVQNREAQARRRGYKTQRTRPSVEPSPTVTAMPFIAWLRSLGEGPNAIARATGIPAPQVYDYLRGRNRRVALDTVDAALIYADTATTLDDLYPLEQAA